MASTSHLRETTAEPQAAVLDQLLESKLWRCAVCNREMQYVSKADHLAGKAHAREQKLVGPLSPIVPSHASSKVLSGATVEQYTNPKKRQAPNTTENPQPKWWTCPSCHNVFSLKQKASHFCADTIQKSSIPLNYSPLDNFFRSYPSFHYNASKPPAISFTSLRDHLAKLHKWHQGSSERDRLWERYQDVLTEEFNLWFGVKDDLDAWQTLCRAMRVNPLPTNCKDCRSSVRGRHVNILDLIEWGRDGGKHVRIFRTVKELSDYSFDNEKIYSKRARNKLKAGAVLRNLLRELLAVRNLVSETYW